LGKLSEGVAGEIGEIEQIFSVKSGHGRERA
jgi:hypothetical protein